MKLIALLSWFDERPAWLAGCIASLQKAGVSHVVAVDGAYGLYPNGRPYSGPEQHMTVITTCRALEMGCLISTPQEPWFGNEVEKRNHGFALAETIAEEDDWYFIIDADEFVTSAIGHTQRLEETDCDVAAVRFTEPYGAVSNGGGCPLRCIFRAIPGLRFDAAHFVYRLPDGRDLHDPLVPALDLSCIEIEHRTNERDPYRKELQQNYYRRRDEMGAERLPEGVLVP